MAVSLVCRRVCVSLLAERMCWRMDAWQMHVLAAALSLAHACSSEDGALLHPGGSRMRWLHGTGLECRPHVLLSRKLIGCIEKDATLVNG